MKCLSRLIPIALVAMASAEVAAQTCHSNVYQNAPTSRFLMIGTLAIDQRTYLEWQRCLAGQVWNEETLSCDEEPTAMNWQDALENTPEGWRLPNIKELMSIVDHSCSYPSINTTVFPMASNASELGHTTQWSSTANRNSNFYTFGRPETLAWAFTFELGAPRTYGKDIGYYVRYVRDYQSE